MARRTDRDKIYIVPVSDSVEKWPPIFGQWLVVHFLKIGVLEEGFLLPRAEGTPQGGVISPLLANIALSAIEERYDRWVHHRTNVQARREVAPDFRTVL